MKRTFASIVALGLGLSGTIGLVGCGETTSVEEKKTIETPGGTQEVTTETSVKKTGDMETGAGTPAPAPAPAP